MRSVVTRSRLSSSSASCPSSVSSVKSPRTSSQTSASSHPPLVLSRSPLRHTSSACSKTPTFAPSTPSGKLHCPPNPACLLLLMLLQCHYPVQGHPTCPPSSWRAFLDASFSIDISSIIPSRHTRSNMTATSVDKHGGKAPWCFERDLL